jgi:Fe-S cluster biogenesis protein NfuA
MPQPEFQQRLQSIEQLLGKIEGAADPHLRTTVQELVQLVMDLHGAGLDRMLELIRAAGDGGESIIQKLGRDELVASLLVLYGLHPMSIEARVGEALDKVRPRLRAHEGDVELLSIQDGAVRLGLQANGHGCGSTAQALKEMVEEAVYQKAPDVTALVVEGVGQKPGFVPIEMLQGAV